MWNSEKCWSSFSTNRHSNWIFQKKSIGDVSWKLWISNQNCWRKFAEYVEVGEMQRNVNLIDLVKSFPTSISLQKAASIQPRTSPLKFRKSLSFHNFSSQALQKFNFHRPAVTAGPAVRARQAREERANVRCLCYYCIIASVLKRQKKQLLDVAKPVYRQKVVNGWVKFTKQSLSLSSCKVRIYHAHVHTLKFRTHLCRSALIT